MSEQVVKRYVSTRLLPDASTWNVSGAAHTYVHISDYAALEAELATVKKVAYGNMELLEENAKLRAELERTATWIEELPVPTVGAAGQLVRIDKVLAAAPSAPKADDPVKQMLLEALENTATWIEQLPVPTVGAAGQLVKIDKAIAAARQEGGKV